MKRYKLSETRLLEETLNESGYELYEIDSSQAGEQIGSMQAWEITAEIVDKNTAEVIEVKVLQSYETAVAVRLPNGEKVRCGRHSRSTSKQCTVWERM